MSDFIAHCVCVCVDGLVYILLLLELNVFISKSSGVYTRRVQSLREFMHLVREK